MSQESNPSNTTRSRVTRDSVRNAEPTRVEPSDPSANSTPSSSTQAIGSQPLPNLGTPIDPATFQQQMFAMMNLLTQSIAANQANPQPSAINSGPSPREPKVKDPETFHGQRNTLNTFLTECDLVFELQPSRFRDDRTKVSYMISFLRDTPLLAIRPLLSEVPRPAILDNYQSFVDHLRTNYGDPDEKGTARRKLKALRQAGAASSYFAEFQQYVAILGWKDQDPIIDKAIEGLKPSLKDELARQGFVPKTLSELITFIIPLDNRLYEREQERKREVKEGPQKVAQPRGTASTTVNSSGNTGTSTNLAQPIRLSTTAIQPNQNLARTFRGPISDAEKQRRRENNLCLRCGKPGHIAVDCTIGRTTPPTNVQIKVEETRPSSAGNANGPTS